MARLDGQISEQLRNRFQTNNIGELELIQGELNNLQTQLKRDLSYAELRNAYAQLFVSTGAEPLPASLPDDKVQTIANALQSSESSWSR